MHAKPSLPTYLDIDPTLFPDARTDVLEATRGRDDLKFTSMAVASQSLNTIQGALTTAEGGVDMVKIASRFAVVRRDIKDIVDLCRENKVEPYVGGGVFNSGLENRSELKQKVKSLQGLGINTVEVSNDMGDVTPEQYVEIVSYLKGHFDRVLSEVGSKYENLSSDDWLRSIDASLKADADNIILEGGLGANCGLYHECCGALRTLLLGRIMLHMREEFSRVIVEAPTMSSQSAVVVHGLGWDARVSNTPADPAGQIDLAALRVSAMDSNARRANEKARTPFLSLIKGLEKKRKSFIEGAINDHQFGMFSFGTPEAVEEARKGLRV